MCPPSRTSRPFLTVSALGTWPCLPTKSPVSALLPSNLLGRGTRFLLVPSLVNLHPLGFSVPSIPAALSCLVPYLLVSRVITAFGPRGDLICSSLLFLSIRMFFLLRFQKACQVCKQPLAPILWSQVASCGVVEQALFWVPERPGRESQLGILLWVRGQSL